MSDGHKHPQDIGCLEAIEALYAWLDGEVTDPDSIAEIERHVAHCHSCFSRAEMERALSDHIRNQSAKQAPEALKSRLRKFLEQM